MVIHAFFEEGEKKMLQEFIDYLNSKVGKCVYVWGSQGQKGSQITEAWIRKRDTSTANANRSIKFWVKLKTKMNPNEIEAYDCSGLGVYWLYNLKHLIHGDTTANGLFRTYCTSISKSQVKKGDWVFTADSSGHIAHVGYVVDDQLNVVEAKGRDHGVIKSHISKGSWNRYGRPHLFKDEIESPNSALTEPDVATPPAVKTTRRTLRITSPYMRGEDVKEIQSYLLENGYEIDKVDGIFGKITEKAVKAFQIANSLVADGIVGVKTYGAMGIS